MPRWDTERFIGEIVMDPDQFVGVRQGIFMVEVICSGSVSGNSVLGDDIN
jgi:hypothetical protein